MRSEIDAFWFDALMIAVLWGYMRSKIQKVHQKHQATSATQENALNLSISVRAGKYNKSYTRGNGE